MGRKVRVAALPSIAVSLSQLPYPRRLQAHGFGSNVRRVKLGGTTAASTLSVHHASRSQIGLKAAIPHGNACVPTNALA